MNLGVLQACVRAWRTQWNNFSLMMMMPTQMGPSSAKPTVRNADVVWLENWMPTAFLNPKSVMEMSFSIAEVWDIRARAHKLQQLFKWQEESAVVERWT